MILSGSEESLNYSKLLVIPLNIYRASDRERAATDESIRVYLAIRIESF